MPITYPRTLPDFVKAVDSRIAINTMTTQSRTLGGGVYAIQTGEPFWSLEWQTQPLTRTQIAEFEAWWSSLRGGQKTFLAYDPFRQIPAAYEDEATLAYLYRAGTTTRFDGTFTVTTVNTASTLWSLSAAAKVPANFQLCAGDWISLSQSGRTSLHRVTVNVTATSAGNFTTGNEIEVEPYVRTSLFSAGAIATVIRACGEFVPDTDGLQSRQRVRPESISFSARSKVMT